MIEAVVQTGEFETTYRRAGLGAPVVLLGRAEGQEPAPWLFDALARRFRAIAPVLPAAARREGAEACLVLESWLRGLIDGLGLEGPAVVADAALGPALLRFDALDPYRLDRVVLLRRAGDPPRGGGAPEDAPDAGPHPVLLCRLPAADDAVGRMVVEAEIMEFLARGR